MATQEFLSGGGELGERIRQYDWTTTPLGPIDSWPQNLRTCVRIMLTSRQPIWIGWGKELIKLYNDPYKQIVAGKHPWALGSPASKVWREIWKEIEPMLNVVMNKDQGTYVESQLLIMERNGYPEETYYTFSYTPIPGDDGTTAGMICANTDDTDRIITERQLKTLANLGKTLRHSESDQHVISKLVTVLSQNRYDFPFAAFYTCENDVATMSGSTLNIGEEKTLPATVDLFANDEIAQAFRFADNLKKWQILDNEDKKFGRLPMGPWQTETKRMVIIPIVLHGANRTHGFLLAGLNPYRLFDEKYSSFFSLVTDQIATSFGEVHAFEEERKRREALAAIDRAKTIFFSNISHEFRTPLTLLLGPVRDALQNGTLTGDDQLRMELVFRNALRMQKLVNTLLEFSRIEAGRVEGKFTRVDIARLTEDYASTFRSAIEAAGMNLDIMTEPISNDVYVDPDMWERIILNLVSNAFKYTQKGVIQVKSWQHQNNLLVSVSDTGVGIAEADLDKIFDRFQRVENTEGRSQEGSGIGLSMVKELVKLHNGSITVTSQRGAGSSFTVSIPLGKDHLPADKIVGSYDSAAGSSQRDAFIAEAMKWLPQQEGKKDDEPGNDGLQHTGDMPANGRYKVLVADDNADMRRYIQQLLAPEFEVATAVDGSEAFDKMLSFKPDLLVSDIMMPRVDGFSLLKKLRARKEVNHTPVIFLSARAGDEAKVEGLDAGADDYLVKPFSAKELISRVSNHIRINRVRRETEMQFYQLFNQTPAIINLLKGPEFRFEFFHPNNRLLFGNVDYTGLTVREAFPELEEQGIFAMLNEVYLNGKTVTQNEREVYFAKDIEKKNARFLNFIYQPWYSFNKKIEGVLAFAVDVTETVENRKKIEESENRFKLLTETLPQLVWMTDAVGAVLFLSSNWDGYAVDGNRHWLQAVHPEDQDLWNERWGNSLKSGKPFKTELRLMNGAGDARWYYGEAQPIISPGGIVEKWIGVFTDIQDQKEAESHLEHLVKQRTSELSRSNEDLQQFAHVASHDLKEPVRKVTTFTQRLEEELRPNLTEKAKIYIEKIRKASERMSSMIEGVLKYSSLGETKGSIEVINLRDIFASIESDLELTIAEKGATIEVTSMPSIDGVWVLIYQLFYNLINNSLKFSKIDAPPRITVTAAHISGKFVTIVVSDNGIGFEDQYAEKIFDVFTRLNSKDRYEGTGLGLSLCKKIAERHGGSITAMGIPGQGARFTVQLPLHQEKLTLQHE